MRAGKALATLAPGDRRRMSDGKNAFRKMDELQRAEYLDWIAEEFGADRGLAPGRWLVGNRFCLIRYR